MKTIAIILIQICLLPALTSAQISGKQPQAKQPAQYWQMNYGYAQSGFSYSIVLETQDLDQIEAKINKLAEAAGLTPGQNQQYMYGRSTTGRNMSFTTTSEKAEPFCQKVIVLTKLKQYSTHSSLNETTYNDVKKKYDMINEEMQNNKSVYEKLPIASSLMAELFSKYKTYLVTYDANKAKASINITLTLNQAN